MVPDLVNLGLYLSCSVFGEASIIGKLARILDFWASGKPFLSIMHAMMGFTSLVYMFSDWSKFLFSFMSPPIFLKLVSTANVMLSDVHLSRYS